MSNPAEMPIKGSHTVTYEGKRYYNCRDPHMPNAEDIGLEELEIQPEPSVTPVETAPVEEELSSPPEDTGEDTDDDDPVVN